MFVRLVTVAALAGSLSSAPAGPQTAAQVLQEAIYTQDTVGDLDGAIRIYRELLNTKSIPRQYAAQAQYRLAECLLRKRDFTGAALEFKKVVGNYPDYKDLAVAAAAQAQRAEAAAPRSEPSNLDPIRGPFATELRRLGLTPPLNAPHSFGNIDLGRIGVVESGRYHHTWTGVEFDVPEGWAFTGNSIDEAGEIVNLIAYTPDSANRAPISEAWVWIAQQNRLTADVDDTLRTEIPRKVALRKTQGFLDWVVRPDSIWWRQIGGQHALTVVAEYRDDGGHRMAEYLTWICSEKSHVQFHVRARLADLEMIQARIEGIVQSAMVP